ncbi:MAG: hypothetical protein ACRDXD_00495 [Acidimicrobiia bacterium]
MRRSVRTVLAVGLGLALLIALAAPALGVRDCSRTSVRLTPLTDLATGEYLGEQGGLYPSGGNVVPEEHLRLGLRLAADIRPLDASGRPDSSGSIGFLSIGVSNTRIEFEEFQKQAEADPAINPAVVLVNGARGGQPVANWVDPTASVWRYVAREVRSAELTPLQVQAAWVKLPPGEEPQPFPTHADTYGDELAQVLRNLEATYPNLKVAYLSSRIYGGYGTGRRALSITGEPFAYENGFAVKWTIEDQILRAEEAGLNADPARGPIEAPWIVWGPYLWADGLGPDGELGGEPGRSDGLEWACHHLVEDGIHPSELGAAEVGRMLLGHLHGDPTARPWFAAGETAVTSSTFETTTSVAAPVTAVNPPGTQPAPIPSSAEGPWSRLGWLVLAAGTGALFGFTVVNLVPQGRGGRGGPSRDDPRAEGDDSR